MNVYMLSGLGADERIFRKLELPPVYTIHHLSWLEPASAREPLMDYCQRLAVRIDRTQPFILIGLSFGGMVCCALNHILSPEKTIIISSVATRQEIPALYTFAGRLGLMSILPAQPPVAIMQPLEWYMGVETEEDKALVRDFLQQTSPAFNRWAMYKVTHWKYKLPPASLWHIHGTADRIFPIDKTKPTHVIEGGGHFMVLNRAAQVSEAILQILEGISR